MRCYSALGTGVRTMGYEPDPPDGVIVTKWVTLMFVPLIPISRKRCRYIRDSQPLGPDLEVGPEFEVLEVLPLSVSSVIATYLTAMAALIATLGPIAFMIWRVQGRAAGMIEFAVLIVLVVWPIALVILKERRDRRLLESTWLPEVFQRNTIMELGNKINREAMWLVKRAFPETVYFIMLVIGILPGVALAAWNGWGEIPMKLCAVASSGLSLGILLLFDRAIMRRRRQSSQPADLAHSSESSRGDERPDEKC